ncbi:macro domain-containing protein [Rhodocytophaga aerolata]|uniref:Macro domain-containing protein n=1 Tax=Rhodocytophaga aerolata TaxID=455078 RepID=A0ABT8RIE9_9BACT|nr:macro domain-containing protein [Rhodocytophaga aerolata]MDO1451874.1 macro domain-containing protein [Rhodocytophaga aerolata]
MKTEKGDLIKKALRNEFDLIIHGCNCFCTMGAGIAKTIKEHFPRAYQADLKTKKGDKDKLGTISWAEEEINSRKLIVVNAYTQYDYRGRGVKADYEAIRKVFKTIKQQYTGLRIGYPAIGAGLAGGDWTIISRIIEEELASENHTFVEFEQE